MRHFRQEYAVAGVLFLLVWFMFIGIASVQSSVVSAQASHSVAGAMFVAPTATVTASSSSSNGSDLDPTIIAAFIALGTGIIVALAGGGFGIYQMRRTIQAQREQLQAQKQAQDEQLRAQHQQAQEMLRLQQEIQEQAQAKERERQHEEATFESARLQMLLAQNTAERVKAYRKALHADPHISRLQILDMSRPLEVTNVYIRVRVHEEARLRYNIDPLLHEAEQQRDPNAMFQASRTYFERRVGTALHPDEALRKYQRCVIIGDPGAGKTTLLKFLALSAVDGTLKDLPDLPIHVEMNAFAAQSSERDLLDFAASQWDERYAFPKADARIYMEKVLGEGKALLLLDALDETVIGEQSASAEDSYQRASDAILRVATRYPQSPIAVTARKAGYQQRMSLTGFTELEVLDFGAEDIEQFVTKWFACFHSQQKATAAAELTAKLQKNARIQALAANPLLLSLIVLVYEAQLDLPDRRADLYKRCVDVLLTEWDARRNIRRRREFKPEHKRQLLAELAWHFHKQGLRYFPKHELQAEIARFLPTIGLQAEQYDDLLQEIANENGLLKEQAHGWYGFLHLTLQEYFVAQYVNDHNELYTPLQHIGDPWWEEVLLLYAGQTPDASPLLQHLLVQSDQQAPPEDLFSTNLVMAGRCLAAHPTIRQVSLREEVIRRLFEQLTTTPYSLTQMLVAKVLAEIDGMAVNSHLLKLLSDQRLNISIRSSIVNALGELGERVVVPDLLELLQDKQIDVYIRQRIANALGHLGERAIVPDLLKVLRDKKVEKGVYQWIVVALGELGERAVVPDLLKLLRDEKIDKDIRGEIALALNKLGERAIVPDLLKILHDKKVEKEVRWAIAIVLGEMREQVVIPDLLEILRDEQTDEFIRKGVASALGRLGERRVVPDLLKLLRDEQINESVRGGIALALGRLGERAVVPDLVKLLKDEQVDKYVRGSIANALGQLGERAVVPDLVKLLRDDRLDRYLYRRIALALGRLGERAVVPDLIKLLRDGRLDKYALGIIADALGQLGERAVVPDLIQLLNDPQLEANVRGRIAEALGQLANDEGTIHAIFALLQTTDIKNNIYTALWHISRLAKVHIIVKEKGASGKEIELLKW